MIMFAKSWFANLSLESWVRRHRHVAFGGVAVHVLHHLGVVQDPAVAVVVEPPVGRLGESDEDVRVLDHGAVDILWRDHKLGPHIAATRLGAVALEHRHPMTLIDGAKTQDLAHADHTLASETGDEDLRPRLGRGDGQRFFASMSAFTRAFRSRMTLENSGRLLQASCLMPVSHTKSVSLPSLLRPCVCS